MSRSNPNVNAPNPALRWFEWSGETGVVRYYDKDANKNIELPLPFTFLLLDELASVRGWDDVSGSGIYSNEIRDTTKDMFLVKSFKGGTIAEGYYKAIKDRVNASGGRYTANCYVAAKLDAGLSICSLRFKGAALGAWVEFRKANRSALYDKAVRVVGFTEGKKGRITYRMPTFDLQTVSAETNSAAVALDKEFQGWLTAYLKRKTGDQADVADTGDAFPDGTQGEPLTDSDIPF